MTAPLKMPVSTLVDSAAHLFRHSAWWQPDSACPGQGRLIFWPGWLSTTASGRPCFFRMELCAEGEVEATLARVQAEHGVRLWLRPIKVPTTWPRGNWWWPPRSCNAWELHLDKAHTALKAAA